MSKEKLAETEKKLIYGEGNDKLAEDYYECTKEPIHNCDVRISIPVKGIKLKVLFEAEKSLRQAGLCFDTGYGGGCRDWEFDWSLTGAYVTFKKKLSEQEQVERWFYHNLYDGYCMIDENLSNPNFLSCSVLSTQHNDIIVIVNGFREKFEEVIERKILGLGGEIRFVEEGQAVEKEGKPIKIGYKLKGKFVTVAYNPDKRY